MRLIDADTAMPYFWEHLDDNGMIAAQNALDDMPTADAINVVRCKDCKYFYEDSYSPGGVVCENGLKYICSEGML